MEKKFWHKGQTGNEWLDEAWFTVAIDGQSLADMGISIKDTYELKDFFLQQQRIFS